VQSSTARFDDVTAGHKLRPDSSEARHFHWTHRSGAPDQLSVDIVAANSTGLVNMIV